MYKWKTEEDGIIKTGVTTDNKQLFSKFLKKGVKLIEFEEIEKD